MNKLSSRPQNLNFGKRVASLTTTRNKKRSANIMKKYYETPKICPECDSVISYKKRQNVFCSKSCGAKSSNKKRTPESRNKQRKTLLNTIGLSEKDVDKFARYRLDASFDLTSCDIATINGYELLLEHRMFHTTKNPKGVSLDHMYSVSDGYANNVDPKIIGHIANCRIILQSENSSKGSRSCITLDELKSKIGGFPES